MKRVLVTGGTGLVGRFVVDVLHANGWQVTVAGRHRPDDRFPPAIGFRRFELDPRADYGSLVTGFDAMVHGGFHHIAGRYSGGEGGDVRGFWDRNFLATLRLFQAAEAAVIERIVFLSSRAVYGQQPAGADVTEETP